MKRTGTIPTHTYWFLAGVVLLVVSMFLPVYEYYGILNPWVPTQYIGYRLWYESIMFQSESLTGIPCFLFAALNFLQIKYVTLKHEKWMIKGIVPEMFISVAFGLLPLCIAYIFVRYTDFLETGRDYFSGTYVIHKGMYVYLAGYIATGIGIVLLGRHARAKEVES